MTKEITEFVSSIGAYGMALGGALEIVHQRQRAQCEREGLMLSTTPEPHARPPVTPIRIEGKPVSETIIEERR